MLVQFSTKIKAAETSPYTNTTIIIISHILSLRKAHECWVNQFGTLSTYITKLELEILNDNISFFWFFVHKDHRE